MPSSRKRTLRDVEAEADIPAPESSNETSLLQRIRNTWQFANLFQWIFLFGKVVKIDDSIDIDVLETECLKPHSTILVDIGLALLKFVSSHRGLTPELFDEYTRRQYVAKNPQNNPFGTEEDPAKFHDFDVITKLRVLQQLTQWVMLHPERIRERMDEQKPSDQTDWRIEPYGWDGKDREYFLLDDDRLYRRTEAPPPETTTAWKPKKNSKKAKAAARAAKRRRVSRSAAATADDVEDGAVSETDEAPEPEDDGFGGAKWECIAVTLGEVQAFLNTIRKTRDENEKILRDRIEEGLVPILEKHEESRKRKELAREKELLNIEKLAHAKRSSRLAGRAERQKQDEQVREEEERRRKEEAATRKEEQQRLKREKERDNRLMSRENRLRDREARRLQHEEELAQLSEDSKNLASDGTGRLSERRLQAEIAKNKQALEELEEEDEDWFFDCVCGVYGQVDDGTHSIACEKCNVWQHSKCASISEEEADHKDFHFTCNTCKRKDANPKATIIKLKVKNPGEASSSPPAAKSTTATPQQQRSGFVVEIPGKPSPMSNLSSATNGSSARFQPRDGSPLPQGSRPQSSGYQSIPVKPSGQTSILPPPSPYTNGEGPNPFSSPHPTLSPPQQSPNKSRAYSTISQSSPPSAPNRIGEHKSLPPKGVFHVSPKLNGASQKPSQPVTSLPPHAGATVPPVAARSDSPLKQPLENAGSSLPILSPPSVSFSASGRPPSSSATPSLLSTPQLKHGQPALASDITTPTLPPSQNGISPLKRSPPPAQHPTNGAHSTPTSGIFPLVAALSPTPSHQVMTPPIKSAEPIRPASQQSSSANGGS
ncbi:hypothetical protein BJ170DRAFT_589311 [Xylariales sp. AK1849]|nr:hypothetical protein BJ170DRAFT_589311 [Xylariales sp. AK1849]